MHELIEAMRLDLHKMRTSTGGMEVPSRNDGVVREPLRPFISQFDEALTNNVLVQIIDEDLSSEFLFFDHTGVVQSDTKVDREFRYIFILAKEQTNNYAMQTNETAFRAQRSREYLGVFDQCVFYTYLLVSAKLDHETIMDHIVNYCDRFGTEYDVLTSLSGGTPYIQDV